MNSSGEVESVLFQLRKIEDERVADEVTARLQRAEAAAEAVRAAERMEAAERARLEAERVTRELTLRVAQLQADASVERARFDTERARLEASVLSPVLVPAPTPRWPVLAALAVSVATTIAAFAWSDARLSDERTRASAAMSALQTDLDARLELVMRRADQAMAAAEAAGTRAPIILPATEPPRPAPTKPTPSTSRPSRPADPPASSGGAVIKPIDTSHPLGGLHH